MTKVFKLFALTLFGMLGMFLVIGLMVGGRKDAAPARAQPSLSVSSVQLAADYAENSVAADQKYKGKRFKVTGTVEGVNTDFTGDPVILMTGVNMFALPQFSFGHKAADQVAKVRKGARLALVCVGRGDVLKAPMSGDCEIAAD